MNLLKIIKNNLFIQNFVANIATFIPPYLEFSLGKYFAIKKAMYITAHDRTSGSYLEFGVFTGSSFPILTDFPYKSGLFFFSNSCACCRGEIKKKNS